GTDGSQVVEREPQGDLRVVRDVDPWRPTPVVLEQDHLPRAGKRGVVEPHVGVEQAASGVAHFDDEVGSEVPDTWDSRVRSAGHAIVDRRVAPSFGTGFGVYGTPVSRSTVLLASGSSTCASAAQSPMCRASFMNPSGVAVCESIDRYRDGTRLVSRTFRYSQNSLSGTPLRSGTRKSSVCPRNHRRNPRDLPSSRHRRLPISPPTSTAPPP